MREAHKFDRKQTLPNGRCSMKDDYTERKSDYFLKYILSFGNEKNCPSEDVTFFNEQMPNYCSQSSIQYPVGAIIAAYINLLL